MCSSGGGLSRRAPTRKRAGSIARSRQLRRPAAAAAAAAMAAADMPPPGTPQPVHAADTRPMTALISEELMRRSAAASGGPPCDVTNGSEPSGSMGMCVMARGEVTSACAARRCARAAAKAAGEAAAAAAAAKCASRPLRAASPPPDDALRLPRSPLPLPLARWPEADAYGRKPPEGAAPPPAPLSAAAPSAPRPPPVSISVSHSGGAVTPPGELRGRDAPPKRAPPPPLPGSMCAKTGAPYPGAKLPTKPACRRRAGGRVRNGYAAAHCGWLRFG